LLAEWDEYISSDINEMRWIQKYLEQLDQPFGILKAIIGEEMGF